MFSFSSAGKNFWVSRDGKFFRVLVMQLYKRTEFLVAPCRRLRCDVIHLSSCLSVHGRTLPPFCFFHISGSFIPSFLTNFFHLHKFFFTELWWNKAQHNATKHSCFSSCCPWYTCNWMLQNFNRLFSPGTNTFKLMSWIFPNFSGLSHTDSQETTRVIGSRTSFIAPTKMHFFSVSSK